MHAPRSRQDYWLSAKFTSKLFLLLLLLFFFNSSHTCPVFPPLFVTASDVFSPHRRGFIPIYLPAIIPVGIVLQRRAHQSSPCSRRAGAPPGLAGNASLVPRDVLMSKFILVAGNLIWNVQASPPRSPAERSGPLKTPPLSPSGDTRNDSTNVSAVLAGKFDDVEESFSFHFDKDGGYGAAGGRHVNDDDDEQQQRRQQKQQQQQQQDVPSMTSTNVVFHASVPSPQHGIHSTSSVLMIAAPSPSPRSNELPHSLHNQHEAPPSVPVSHVLASLDSAEAALAQALQGVRRISSFINLFVSLIFLSCSLRRRRFQRAREWRGGAGASAYEAAAAGYGTQGNRQFAQQHGVQARCSRRPLSCCAV